ncbi:5'-nucleotidase [Skermanella stibiiresistens SB22]|uniref:5'-nucleotidase SurE n=1 Tax=Skermanella stibiiresistens SB22 TaxID=1385369 RepID=W9H493_9PROT|nr:5'/3'-nucleotidase SurE [Skermanella stibiiresistens]EWY39596.1 5'-nucleotidase [Skermanella stibiiresistens SB22]
MTDRPFNRVLLTNDDGIGEPGLNILEEVAATLAREVWVVAPEHDQSGTANSISLHQPIRVRERGPLRYSVNGTPADCILMGVQHLMADQKPDLVLSGINAGANLGDDVAYSGTVAGAMTALFLGIPGIALSQSYRERKNVPWATATHWAPTVIRSLTAGGWPGDLCYNVNFPDVEPDRVSGMEAARQGEGGILRIGIEQREDTREKSYYWLRFMRERRALAPDTDVAALKRGAVAVTPLKFDRTDMDAMTSLRQTLA